MIKAVIEFINGTDEATKVIDDIVDISVGKSILVLERNIKANTPVRHGYLRRSITSKMVGKGKGEVFTNPIGSITTGTANKKGISRHKEVNYAVYVEYGTSKMAPRAMFRKGAEQSQDQITQLFDEQLNNVKLSITQ